MTILDANQLFRGWKDAPPVFVLLKSIVEGLGGKPDPKLENAEVDKTITEIARNAGRALPVIRRPDKELARFPMADEETMRQRNEALRRHLRIVDNDVDN